MGSVAKSKAVGNLMVMCILTIYIFHSRPKSHGSPAETGNLVKFGLFVLAKINFRESGRLNAWQAGGGDSFSNM